MKQVIRVIIILSRAMVLTKVGVNLLDVNKLTMTVIIHH